MTRGLSRANWRDTGRRTRFMWVLDSQTLPFFFFLLVHLRPWVFYLTFGVVVFFSGIGYLGYPLPVFVRRVRHRLAGRRRSARPWWYWKRFTTRVI